LATNRDGILTDYYRQVFGQEEGAEDADMGGDEMEARLLATLIVPPKAWEELAAGREAAVKKVLVDTYQVAPERISETGDWNGEREPFVGVVFTIQQL
jgi:hypothetical protein